jgi:hypothetical protein
MNTIFTHCLQLVMRFQPQGLPPPPDLEAPAQPLGLEVNNHNIDWAKIMMTFCLAFAPSIPLTYAQVHSKFSPTFHVVSFEFLLCLICFLLRQQVHEFQVSGDSPIAPPSRCLLCSHSLLHSRYNFTSSVAPNCQLVPLCHFLRGGYSNFHYLLAK